MRSVGFVNKKLCTVITANIRYRFDIRANPLIGRRGDYYKLRIGEISEFIFNIIWIYRTVKLMLNI